MYATINLQSGESGLALVSQMVPIIARTLGLYHA